MGVRFQSRYIAPLIAVAAALLICAACLFFLTRDTSDDAASDAFPVRINEILASNGSYPNSDGVLCDWIELYNDATVSISLAGYKLSDSERVARYIFPAGTRIEPKGYLVISCTGDRSDGLYAGFSLSKDGGEAVSFYNRRNVVIDRVVTWPMRKDQPMARQADGSWALSAYATPMHPNTDEGLAAYLNMRNAASSAVCISELMADNVSVLADKSGEYHDWIELTNTSSEPVNLTGFYLSDDVADPYRWPLPEAQLAPQSSLVVFASGKDMQADGEYHTDFRLAKAHGSVLLSGPDGLVYDHVEYADLGENYACQRQADGGFLHVPGGSPGTGETGTAAQDAANYAGVFISELMPANGAGLMDADGAWSDWIELTNGGREAVQLANCWLSVNENTPFQYRLLDAVLAPGERLLLYASGKERVIGGQQHTGFKLPRDHGALWLYSPQGALLDALAYPYMEKDQSVARDGAGDGAYVSDAPTPGRENTAEAYAQLLADDHAAGPLCISEVMPSNDRFLPQGVDQFYDIAEILNLSGHDVQLGGYCLSNDAAVPAMWRFPERTLAPGERLVVFCSGEPQLGTEAAVHANFTLSAGRDRLYLFGPSGSVLDAYPFSGIPYGFSYGRTEPGKGLGYFAAPTPGQPNGEACANITASPVASIPAGVYDGVGQLMLRLDGEGSIFYTLDGSLPTTDSLRYSEPLAIDRTAVIRAIACRADALPSRAVTLTYIVNEGHTLPVVSLVADPEDLFGYERGIYVVGRYGNNTREWERQANLSFLDGTDGFSVDCGVALSGRGSRVTCEKKSFKILFRPRYGQSSVQYDLFEGCGADVFTSLVLRAGEDYIYSVIREELFTSLAADASDALLTQAFRYCVLYVNGEYFGVYCLKERFSEDYYAAHFGVPSESVQLLEGSPSMTDLRTSEFHVVSRFVSDHDMRRDAEAFAYVESKMDFQSMIDWCIFEAYCANSDLAGNVRYFKSDADDGKWRYAFFDMDWAFYFRGRGFDRSLGEVAAYNRALSGLIKNESFRDMFIQRLDELTRTTLSDENVHARIDELAAIIADEMPRDRERWGRDMKGWHLALGRLHNYVDSQDLRRGLFRGLMKYASFTPEQIQQYLGA